RGHSTRFGADGPASPRRRLARGDPRRCGAPKMNGVRGATHARRRLKPMPTRPNPYRQDLDRSPANPVPLTPISLIEWAADVYPGHCAGVHGDLPRSWAELYERARRFASALAARDIGDGDTV